MEIVKELKDISLPISEPEYRQRPELSYSTLSTYESLGYNGLEHLFDRKETPSLTFGSAVDVLTTDGMEAFNEHFTIMDINVTEGGMDTCRQLISMNLPFDTFEEIPEDIVSTAAKVVGFWQADKWDKIRYKKVLETGNVSEYYKSLRNTEKTVIDSITYQDALACVQALKESPATRGYFADDDPFTSIRRYYQLKFAANLDGVGYRGMMDLIVVDYENKIIYPCDLKTMSLNEWDFESNFVKFHYFIQGRLYWRLLRANLDNDEYFKDFKLENFKFIVVNRKSLTPLVWEFPLTKEYGTLIDERGNEYRDPFEIGKELQGYLDCKPPVPNGISIDGVNEIKCLKLKSN